MKKIDDRSLDKLDKDIENDNKKLLEQVKKAKAKKKGKKTGK